MPIPKEYVEPVLNTYRDMKKDCENRGLTGPMFDEMTEQISRLERYTEEFSDFTEFNVKVMDENLYTSISMLYTRLLNEAAKPKTGADGKPVYDEETDKGLLKQTLSVYKGAIDRIREGKQEAIKFAGTDEEINALFKEEAFIKPVEDVISLGESGVNYPVFLRLMIERGMDKAMESSIVTRWGLVYTLDFYKSAMINPHYIDKYEKYIQLYDDLAGRSEFNAVEVLQHNLGCEKIDYAIDPHIKKWDSVKHYWERVINSLSEWSISWCSFAHTLEPWRLAENPKAAVQETRECEPGYFEVKLHQLKKYHGLEFHDIFTQETFFWEVKWHHLWYSMEYTRFLVKEVYPHCKPGQQPPPEVIAKAEEMHKQNKYQNPELLKVHERYEQYYNKYFGEGYYRRKNKWPDPLNTNAAPWNWDEFNDEAEGRSHEARGKND